MEGKPAKLNRRDGSVEYLGLAFKPNAFRIRFLDGTSVQLSLTRLRPALLSAQRSLGGVPATPAPTPAVARNVQ